MDKALAVKLLTGTIARGLLWVVAAVATKYGIENTISEDTFHAVAGFAAAVVVTVFSAWWSARKNKKLLAANQTLPRAQRLH